MEAEYIPGIKNGSQLITPEKAKRLLTYNTLGQPGQIDFQRRISPMRKLQYMRDMRNHRWDSDSRIHLAVIGNQVYLIDGQHRLMAIIETGLPQVFVITYTRCKDLEEVRGRYSRIDGHGPRSIADAIRAMNLPAEYDLSSSQIRVVIPAAHLIARSFCDARTEARRGTIPGSYSRDENLEMVEYWHKEAAMYFHLLRPCHNDRELYRRNVAAPILGVALVTYRDDPLKARLFWPNITSITGLRDGSPEAAAVRYISFHKVNEEGQEKFARNVANTWNAFYEGRDFRRPGVIDPTLPIRIAGTQFTGSKHIFGVGFNSKNTK
jgi:hypothetical protein